MPPIDKIIETEKLEFADDLALDQQLMLVEEASATRVLLDGKQTIEVDAIDRLNTDLKQFQIRSSLQSYDLQQDKILQDLQAYDLQPEAVTMVDEIA
ncbi:MAG TPA: hypothetical protein DE179_14170 [Oceanospirillaceae bacterium]|nr:hypothetical protein [Oceanospirillaceae bacterium]